MDDSGSSDHRMDKINLTDSGSAKGAAGILFMVLSSERRFCVFCTEEQMSMCHFHEFCTLTKKTLKSEASSCIMSLMVLVANCKQWRGDLPERSFDFYVHS